MIQMEKISLNRFRCETRHKKVVYKWLGRDGKAKEFETDKFYCNIYGKGSFKMLSMPKFCLSADSEFFKLAENEYLAVSEFGKTQFMVVAQMEGSSDSSVESGETVGNSDLAFKQVDEGTHRVFNKKTQSFYDLELEIDVVY